MADITQGLKTTEGKNKGGITPPPNVTPSVPKVITKPELENSLEVNIVEDKSNRNVTAPSETRTIISNPQQAKGTLDKQADKARNPSKSTKSPKKSGGNRKARKGPTVPGLKRPPSPPIRRAGPKIPGRRKAMPKRYNIPAPAPASPQMQIQGMHMYRTVAEAIAAQSVPPPPAGPVARSQKRKLPRRPNESVSRDDPKSVAQKPKPVAELISTEEVTVKKPADQKAMAEIGERIQREVEEQLQQKEKDKERTSRPRYDSREKEVEQEISDKMNERRHKLEKAKIARAQPHKQESKPEETVKDLKSADRASVEKEPSPPHIVSPKALVGPVITIKPPVLTRVADKTKHTKVSPRGARKRTPKVGIKKR